MILEGNARGLGAELAHHLLNPRDNDHVTLHAVDGFVADDLFGAFAETEAISGGTQCQKYLFSLSLNPPPDANVTVEVFEETIAAIERKLGLSGQPRAIVFHEKLGRRHAHCVWSRIDAGKMKAIKLSHYKRKLMDISRELYRAHDWEMPDGFRDHGARDPHNFSRQEAGQAKRAKADPKALKAMFQQCWIQSDSRSAFSAALWEQGYLLARGNRRGFVAVDTTGKVWSLSRWCGVKPKELRARLGSEDDLWTIDAALDAFETLNWRASAEKAADADEPFDQRFAALVQRQRAERQELKAAQDARRINEQLERKRRLPRGVKAIWAKATGRYQKLVQDLAAETAAAHKRDSCETQAVIDRHLAERRELERSRTPLDILAELQAEFEHVTRPDPRQKLILPADGIPFSQTELLKHPDLILGHISEKHAHFTRADVLTELAKRIQDPIALKVAADDAMASDELVAVANADDETLSTKDYLSAKAHLSSIAGFLAKRGGFAVHTTHINAAIERQNSEMKAQFGGHLSDEQRDALHHILGDQQLANVVGLAGSGKSTLLKAACAAWIKQGVKVHGAALAGKATDGLESASGIPARTLASLETSWKNGYEPIAPGDVLVVDEAGMIGTRQLRRIVEKMHGIGAKLVLVGDPDQLQPIEAGTPFRDLIEGLGTSRLSEIHRQREQWQRKASRDLADGNAEEALKAYAQNGAVYDRANRETALAALVEDYLEDTELNGTETTRLAFAHRRKDVFAINQAIRAALKSSRAGSPDTLVETETGPRAFAKGDRIAFTRNDKGLGVKNGMLGTVKHVGDNQVTVLLDTTDGQGRTVTFDSRRYNSFDHGYAVTIHKSQGATVDQSYVLASRTMDEPLAYVAMTRHRDRLGLYINSEDRPKWLQRVRTPGFTRQRRQSGPTV